jgi:hypothetical protein
MNRRITMKSSNRKMNRIYGELKSCFKQLDMPVQNEDLDEHRPNFWTEWDDGQFYNAMLVVYFGDLNLIKVFSFYNEVPDSVRVTVLEALNKINEELQTACFTVDIDNRVVVCHGGLYVEGAALRKRRFRKILLEILKCVFLYTETIDRLTTSGQIQEGLEVGNRIGVEDHVETIAT